MECGLTDNQEVFDAIAQQYRDEDQHWGSNLEAVKAALSLAEDLDVWVDAGCGPGHHIAAALKDQDRSLNQVVGIDYSEAMIQEAKSRLDPLTQDNDITLKQCDITRPDRLPAATTVTCLNNTFGNILIDGDGAKARRAFLENMAAALRPGGSFLFSVYHVERVGDTYGDNLSVVKADRKTGDFVVAYEVEDETIQYYSHWFTEDELRSLFTAQDLAVTSIEEDAARLLVKGVKP